MQVRAALLGVLAATGCASSVQVTQTYTPQAAVEAQRGKLRPVAIVRDKERIDVGEGATVQTGSVVLPGGRAHVHRLAPDDVIERDAQRRVVGVRSVGGHVTRFIAGTAEEHEDWGEVRGQLEQEKIALRPGDGIEMRGEYSAGDSVPGGARVESKRSTGWLVTGVSLFLLSYAPAAIAGAESPLAIDRVLEVPLAGPWINLNERPACVPPITPIKPPVDPCLGERAARVLVLASGVTQGLGALFIGLGVLPHAKLVEGSDRRTGLAVIPTAAGAAAVGSF